jgi:hypothetical protein
MKKDEVFKRIDWLLENGNECLTHLQKNPGNEFPWCPSEFYLPFKAATRSFFSDIAGTNSPYWHELDYALKTGQDYNIRTAINMIKQFKAEIEQGFLDKLESRITGEIFTDFLEMAEFLVSETCYDAAAVMAGGVLEEHLRKLCSSQGISLTRTDSGGRAVNKLAANLNDDLKGKLYSKTEHDSVKVLIQIRNDGAHTGTGVVDKGRAESIILGIKAFITRYPLP